jgi:tetratricopeptide (TPR) repeat protein/transcriptional regulator with XRE-family HTH domain
VGEIAVVDQPDSTLKRFRLRAGLTQEVLADRSGVSVRTIRGLETGTRDNPRRTSLRQLADALGLAPHEREQLAGLESALTSPSSTHPVPGQLPPPSRGFVGRDTELAALDRADEGEIHLLVGAGGIGKTSLAVHWAHRCGHRFPDGQLFVDLGGFSPDGHPVNPLTALRGFLDALGGDSGPVAGGLAEHTALYRSRIAGKRMLIVLDNAANADQVVPLLPGTTSCTVVVTSRKTLTALLHRHGARHLTLAAFDQDEAHALLVQRLGDTRVAAEPDAAAQLITLCGRYPLALAITAGRAHTRPDIPLAEFAMELREHGLDALDDGDPVASLPAVLSLSVRDLTERQRTVFALLGIAPGPDIGPQATASLAALSQAEVLRVLRELEDASLVRRQAHGRYSTHDLIRAYAAATAHQTLTEDERDTALRRILAFYLHTAHAADHFLNPHGPAIELDLPAPAVRPHPPADAAAALAWFDVEHPNLLATLHTAAGRAWHRSVWQLTTALNTYHRRRTNLHELLSVRRTALDAATHLPDHGIHILALRRLGRTYAELGRREEAIHHLRQALAIAQHHEDLNDQAHLHRMLALAHGLREDHGPALDHATLALNLYRVVDNSAWEADARNQVGWHTAHLGDYATAATHCRAALVLQREHVNSEGAADALTSLGYIAHHTGHHQQAVDHYQLALSAYRTLGNTRLATDTLARLGHPYAALRRHDRAAAVWREAQELYRRLGRDDAADRMQQELDGLGEHMTA